MQTGQHFRSNKIDKYHHAKKKNSYQKHYAKWLKNKERKYIGDFFKEKIYNPAARSNERSSNERKCQIFERQ